MAEFQFQQLIQSFDSLWFFTNPLSHPPPIPTTVSIESVDDSEDPEQEQSNQEQSNNPIAVIQSSAEIFNHDDDQDSNYYSKAIIPSSPEEAIESPPPEKQSDNGGGGRGGEIVVFESKPESPLERRKRMARRSRSKRKILLELDLCFDDLDLFFPRSYGVGGGGNFGRSYGILVSQRGGEIPSSLNDSLAMKRQIKSWAHAVACTVK